jgi:AcrR family transcriptional regulator
MSATRARKPASERRLEVLAAATVEFAETGLAGTRLEVIAARAEISHPRIVQMFGTKRALFLGVIESVFDRIETAFTVAASGAAGRDTPALVLLGNAYRRLLERDRAVGLVMLQGYAAAADDAVRTLVSSRYRRLQRTVTALTGTDPRAVRSFFATGLVFTVSTVLELPDRHVDTDWAEWLLAQSDTKRRELTN